MCPWSASLISWEGDLNLLCKELFLESELSFELPVIFWELTGLEDSAGWAIVFIPVLAVEELNGEAIEGSLFGFIASGCSLLQNELVNFEEVVLWEIKGEPEVFLGLIFRVVETALGSQVVVVVTNVLLTPCGAGVG